MVLNLRDLMKLKTSPHCGHRSQDLRFWKEAHDDLTMCRDHIDKPTVPLY